MGKKSKSKKKQQRRHGNRGHNAENVGNAPGNTGTTGTTSFLDPVYIGANDKYSASFRFTSPLKDPTEWPALLRSLSDHLNDPTVPIDDTEGSDGVWRVYCRRSRMYESHGGSMPGLVRPWWVVFAPARPDDRPNAAPFGLRAHLFRATCVVDRIDCAASNAGDGMKGSKAKGLGMRESDHPLTAEMLLACLSKVIKDGEDNGGRRVRPRELLLWPAKRGAFRPNSVRRLEHSLRVLLELMDIPGLAVSCLDVSDSDDGDGGRRELWPYGTDRICFPNAAVAATDPEIQLYVEPGGAVDSIEEFLRNMAEDPSRAGLFGGTRPRPSAFIRGWDIKCISETVIPPGSVSVWEMRRLFDAARQYHDNLMWRKLMAWRYLEVTVPDVFVQSSLTAEAASSADPTPVVDLGTTRERTFVVVIINGVINWHNRGLYFYYTLDEMERATANEPVRYSALRYFERTATPFRTLDHIAELDLGLPTGGIPEKSPEVGYPSFYQTSVPIFQEAESDQDADYYKKLWGRAPPRHDLASIALATLAAVKFGMEDAATGEREPSRSIVREYDLGIPGLEGKAAKVRATMNDENTLAQLRRIAGLNNPDGFKVRRVNAGSTFGERDIAEAMKLLSTTDASAALGLETPANNQDGWF